MIKTGELRMKRKKIRDEIKRVETVLDLLVGLLVLLGCCELIFSNDRTSSHDVPVHFYLCTLSSLHCRVNRVLKRTQPLISTAASVGRFKGKHSLFRMQCCTSASFQTNVLERYNWANDSTRLRDISLVYKVGVRYLIYCIYVWMNDWRFYQYFNCKYSLRKNIGSQNIFRSLQMDQV